MPKVNRMDTEHLALLELICGIHVPLDIKLSSSVSVFKTKLKTHLFKQCYGLTN